MPLARSYSVAALLGWTSLAALAMPSASAANATLRLDAPPVVQARVQHFRAAVTSSKAEASDYIVDGKRFTVFKLPGTGTDNGGVFNMIPGHHHDLWLSQWENNDIVDLSTDGSYRRIALPNAAPVPWGMTFGPNDELWYASYANAIAKIASDGSITAYAYSQTDMQFQPLVWAADGKFWTWSFNHRKMFTVTPDGTFSERAVGLYWSVVSMARGGDGHAWFVTQGGLRSSGHTDLIGYYPENRQAPLTLPVGSLGNSWNIFASRDGRLWLPNARNRSIDTFDPKTMRYEVYTQGIHGAPQQVTVASDGTAYFTEASSNGHGLIGVLRNGVTREYALPGNLFQSAMAVAEGPDGNIWFTDRFSAVVGRFTP